MDISTLPKNWYYSVQPNEHGQPYFTFPSNSSFPLSTSQTSFQRAFEVLYRKLQML